MGKGEMNNEIPPQTGDPYGGDPTSHAAQHGNKPSRGAVKDKEIIDEEKEILAKMDEAKKQSEEAHAPKLVRRMDWKA